MWSFFRSSYPPSAKWYQSTSSNSAKQATHCNTPKRITVTGSLSLEEIRVAKLRVFNAERFDEIAKNFLQPVELGRKVVEKPGT
jgi:hypothetical protein